MVDWNGKTTKRRRLVSWHGEGAKGATLNRRRTVWAAVCVFVCVCVWQTGQRAGTRYGRRKAITTRANRSLGTRAEFNCLQRIARALFVRVFVCECGERKVNAVNGWRRTSIADWAKCVLTKRKRTLESRTRRNDAEEREGTLVARRRIESNCWRAIRFFLFLL